MKILFLTQQLPFPPESGGSIKTLQTIKLLAKRHKLYLVCFASSSKKASFKKQLENICQRAEVVVSPYPTAQFKDIKGFIFKSLFSPLPFIVYRHKDERMEEIVRHLIKDEQFDAIHIDHLNMATYLPKEKTSLWVLEEHNIESEINWEIFKKERFDKFKLFSLLEFLKLAFFEKKMLSKFDWILAISEEDKKKLAKKGVNKEKIIFLPTPFKINNLFNFQKKLPAILFVGMLSWWPNKDGLLWFYKNVFPLIKKKISDIKFFVVGKEAPQELVNLSRKDSHLKLVGYVRNLGNYLNKASVFVAPLRSGSGIRIKILTALSNGLPVVSTTKGAEGIVGKNREGIILANGPEKFAQAIIKIIKDKNLAKKLSYEGIDFIKNNFSVKKSAEVLQRIYG